MNYQRSLTEMCQHLFKEGVKMRKQSLDARLNGQAAEFLKTTMEELLKAKLFGREKADKMLSRFTAVHITDATSFQLPNALSKVYKGLEEGLLPAVSKHITRWI